MMMKTPPSIKLSDKQSRSEKDRTAHQVSAQLLFVLVCPLTRSGLIYDAEQARLVSLQAGLSYPIKGFVPIMLEEAAQPLSDAELARYKKKPPPPEKLEP